MSESGKTSVVLLNMGGPDSLDAIRPFLQNLFSDPEILDFPLAGLVRKPLARRIAVKRSRRVIHNYRAIGGRSPLREITEAQALALEEALGGREAGFAVHVAMRYWRPRAEAAATEIRGWGAERLVVLPLYPQFCRATTGSSLRDLEEALQRAGRASLPRFVIRSWAEYPPYVATLAETVREALDGLPGATVLFSAHGLPVKIIAGGDPYLDQVRATVKATMEHLPGVSHRLAFQSRTGPVKWLEPSVSDMLRELAAEGVTKLVVVPVSFVSDHIETLHELDIEYREEAERLGIDGFRRAAALNTRPAFIQALARRVREELEA